MKYIVVRGDAKNHENKLDVLDNICNIVYDHKQALKDAAFFIESGSFKAQVYKLDFELRVEDVVLDTGDEEKNIKLKDYLD